MIYEFNNVFAIRKAGMFIIILSTIWVALAGDFNLYHRLYFADRYLLILLDDPIVPRLGTLNHRLHPGTQLSLGN